MKRVGQNVTLFLNHSKSLILQFQKEIDFRIFYVNFAFFGSKIQTFEMISQCFKITQIVSFYNFEKKKRFSDLLTCIVPFFFARTFKS